MIIGKAIKEYLSGGYSQFDICIKYEISSVSVLQRCIMLYNNNHNITKSYPDKYNQIYIWVKKYKQKGYEGLEDRRAKTKPFESMD